jgi:ankyrin repeat protein
MIFNDTERLNERQFPKLHSVVLGLDKDVLQKALLEPGINIDEMDGWGRTALHWAAFRGDIAAVRTLLANGANPTTRDTEYGWTAIHFASHAKDLNDAVFHALVHHGANINAQDGGGWSPLAEATRAGNFRRISTFLQLGANLNAQDHEGWTAVQSAIYFGQCESLKVLV